MTQPPTGPNYGSPLPPSFQPSPQYQPSQYQVPPSYPAATSPYGPAPSYQMAAPLPAYGYETAPVKRSPIMGIIGLLVVGVAAVVYFLCWKTIYDGIFTLLGPEVMRDSSVVTAISPEELAQFQGPVSGIGISSLVGIAGFIVSIVATVRGSGRPFGIIGIILGVLAPFLLIAAAFAAYAAV